MAGDRRGDEVEPVAERDGAAELGDFSGEVGEQRGDIGFAERGGDRADEHRGRAEALDVESEVGQAGGGLLEPVAIDLVEFDAFGDQQHLARDLAVGAGGAHPFEHEPFVRGMLVDDDQAVLGLGDDIGLCDLAAGDAERVGGDGRGGGFGAGGGGEVGEVKALVVERSRAPGGGRGPASLCLSRWVVAFAGMTDRGGFTRGPLHRRRHLLARGTAVTGCLERLPQSPDDQPAHRGGVAEADFGLGGMDVDVDLASGQLDEQRGDRVAVAREQVAVGGAQGPHEQPVLHRTRVDEQELLVGHAAVEGRQADHPGEPQLITDMVDAHPVPLEPRVEQRRDAGRRIARLDGDRPAPVMLHAKADVGPGQREPLHRVHAGGIFGAGGAQELAPRGDLVEQPFDPHPCPRRDRSGPLACPCAMIDGDSPPLACPALAAFEREARHAGDRRQCLAAKAEAQHLLDPLVGKLRGRMPLERKRHIGWIHSQPVVADLDEIEPARCEPDRHRRRAGVKRILDQLLERACRTLDDLARGDAIDQSGGKPSY